MRLVLVLALACLALAACSSSDGPCPGGFSCSADGESCTQAESDPPAACYCQSGGWTCTNCPDLELPRGTCSPGVRCSVWGFENACLCTCDASGQWSCSVDDPSPNFHCSF